MLFQVHTDYSRLQKPKVRFTSRCKTSDDGHTAYCDLASCILTICYRHLSARDTNRSTRSHNNSSGCTCTYAGPWSYPILFCSYTDIKMFIHERKKRVYGLLCPLVMIRHTAVSDMSQHDYCLSRTKVTVPLPTPKDTLNQNKRLRTLLNCLTKEERTRERKTKRSLPQLKYTYTNLTVCVPSLAPLHFTSTQLWPEPHRAPP